AAKGNSDWNGESISALRTLAEFAPPTATADSREAVAGRCRDGTQEKLQADPFSGCLFLFRSRRAKSHPTFPMPAGTCWRRLRPSITMTRSPKNTGYRLKNGFSCTNSGAEIAARHGHRGRKPPDGQRNTQTGT